MNKLSNPGSFLGALSLGLLLSACGGGGDSAGAPAGGGGGGGGGGTPVAVTSHLPGQDCLSCHRTGGSGAGKGIFTVAGTVYKNDGTAQTAATVNLYTHNTSTLLVALTTDGLGNFFTTQAVSALVPAPGQQFAVGADVAVRTSGGSRSMPGVITNGSCNACHGAAGAGNPGRVVAQAGGQPGISIASSAGNGESLDVATAVSLVDALIPKIIDQPVAASAPAGSGAQFMVSAAASSPVYYQWRRNSEALVGATGTVLDIDPVSASEDGASFDVVVTNAFGSVISEPVLLSISQPE
jgi:mono/diheme cytochrome c family protein